ncbi:MAG: PsiF family protein [Rhodanobacter sp.]|nr:PsiF family protein [Rhodanobacter sp.]
MSISLRVLAFSVALAMAGATFAAVPQTHTATPPVKTAKTRTPQQQRMVNCNKQATGKKGDERKAFMRSCLRSKTAVASATPTARQARHDKMKHCKADAKAKALTGADRKTFVSGCLKGTSTPTAP